MAKKRIATKARSRMIRDTKFTLRFSGLMPNVVSIIIYMQIFDTMHDIKFLDSLLLLSVFAYDLIY